VAKDVEDAGDTSRLELRTATGEVSSSSTMKEEWVDEFGDA
jgi:hypothetical protein